MTLEVRETEWSKPLPASDGLSAEFWSALLSGRLLIQSCPECDHRQYYPRLLCESCGSEPVWTEASGRGTVHTFTVVRQNGVPAFRDEIPYVVAMIELDEGPRMMGNLTGCAPEAVHIGMPVQAYVLRASEEVGLPMWEPASD